VICLTGQISDLSVQPPLQKYFDSHPTQITCLFPPSGPTEGRLAIVTNAGRDAVDAEGADNERHLRRTAKSCGPGAPTLAFKLVKEISLATVANKPGHRGEHEISVKTIARGMPGEPA
jgi:hypothetical protein